MKTLKPNNAVLLLIALSVFFAIIITDLLTPIHYAHWLLYIIPLLIIYATENTVMTYLLLLISVPAIVIGHMRDPFSPSSYENIREISLVNRMSGIAVLVIFTLIINRVIQARKRYRLLSSELEYANKELESFSYSAAHDLKAPVLTMRSFSQILIEDYGKSLDNQAIDYLRIIDNGSFRMVSLIDDMLSLSKVSLRELNLQETDISAIAQSIMAELKSAAPERNVEVHIEKGMKARADSGLIRIALANLIGNAWKYTSKKEFAVISIKAKYAKNEILFSVKDNGIGFDMKLSSDLFIPFKRLHSESEYKGTGIGLSIVDRVIRRHRGRVWAESAVNCGATFYFTLPK